IGDATRNQSARRALAVSSSAKHQNFSGRQVAENSLRKIDGHRSNRDRAARDLSAATNLLGHAKRALKQAMKIRAGRSACTCAFICLLCLSENFRFTHHHRVDPGGYAKKMLHTLNLF